MFSGSERHRVLRFRIDGVELRIIYVAVDVFGDFWYVLKGFFSDFVPHVNGSCLIHCFCLYFFLIHTGKNYFVYAISQHYKDSDTSSEGDAVLSEQVIDGGWFMLTDDLQYQRGIMGHKRTLSHLLFGFRGVSTRMAMRRTKKNRRKRIREPSRKNSRLFR